MRLLICGARWEPGFPLSLALSGSDANLRAPFPRMGTAVSLCFSEVTGVVAMWGGAGPVC